MHGDKKNRPLFCCDPLEPEGNVCIDRFFAFCYNRLHRAGRMQAVRGKVIRYRGSPVAARVFLDSVFLYSVFLNSVGQVYTEKERKNG